MLWCNVMVVFMYFMKLTMGDQPTILIVGAGSAGVAAASKLYEHGFEHITILEAENRTGGRVYSARFGDNWIELGAQQVHGQLENIVYELASPFELLDIPSYSTPPITVYNSKGYKIPDLVNENLIDFYFRIQNEIGHCPRMNVTSVGEYFQRVIETELSNIAPIDQTIIKQFEKLFEGFSLGEEASDTWFDVSVKGYQDYWESPGNDYVYWKDKPYSTIFDILTKKYPNPEQELPVWNKTLLNQEVLNIDYNSTKGKASVVTTTGERYIVDHVIVTLSLGVLKEQYETLFTPHLPESKANAIQSLGFGVVSKMFFTFETPWWTKEINNFGFVWDENDKQEYENDLDRKWLLDVVGIFELPHRPGTLIAWVSGASARHMESLPEDEVFNQTLALINKFLGKSHNITRPTGFTRSIWHNNKHFRGTYSYRSLESQNPGVQLEQLAAPLFNEDKPIVLFAGEATSSHHFATVHGAIDTGFREAQRLINMYKNLPE